MSAVKSCTQIQGNWSFGLTLSPPDMHPQKRKKMQKNRSGYLFFFCLSSWGVNECWSCEPLWHTFSKELVCLNPNSIRKKHISASGFLHWRAHGALEGPFFSFFWGVHDFKVDTPTGSKKKILGPLNISAPLVMAMYSCDPYRYGLHSYGRYSYGPYSYSPI